MKDIYKELQKVFLGKNKILDAVLPPLLFILLNAFFDLQRAVIFSFIIAVGFLVLRMRRSQRITYSLAGLLGVIVSLLFVYVSQDARNYFLPGILRNVGLALLLLLSVVFKRPLMAYSSFIARRWELGWYFHDNVRPAYSEATLLWSAFFLLKAYIQYFAVTNTSLEIVGVVAFLSGFPSTIILLIITYVVGKWRLKTLKGPSVDEFKNNTPPPWKGQLSGF